MHVFLYGITGILSLIPIILLQIFLSKKESKIPGLILPTINFLFSLLYLLQAMTFLVGLVAFLLANIPTIIFLLIYLTHRRKK
ncbi:hypothetical protein [Alkalithermobacter paradoxus]|uniref:PQ loop repeat protein n=1 Tax=Alkalithermobacter paradoxus TaxID=29349 RepID=A0A1V4I7L2_9FIRM|nr:hypothetical protein CLOTH_11340 [[Clostridium] thermoalcaliphilum]